MEGYLLGIDIGTSSCKTVLFSVAGAVVYSAKEEYVTIYGANGEVEQNPLDWWNALCSTTQKVLEGSGIDPAQIRAVGLDAQSSAFIPVSADHDLLHNALIWTDHRARAQQQWLEEYVDPKVQISINGNRFDASNVGTKALWWKQTHGAEYEKTAVILNACGYIVYMLTGNDSCNISEADLSQLSDQETGTWSDVLMDAYGLDAQKFPPIFYGDEIAGTVTPAAAAATGLAPGTPVTVGAMDVCATALGSGVFCSGNAVITGGTVTGIALCDDRFVIQNTAHVYHHMIKNRWIYCASIDFGGGSLRWFRDKFMDYIDDREDLYNLMDDMALQIRAGSDNLIFLPYLAGQRCPEWDSNMAGVFFGLRPHHGKAHCIRAIMEGTAFGLSKIAEMFRKDGILIRKLMVAGGCAKSEVWMDIFSQVLSQSNLYDSLSEELAALGSALGAGLAVGVYPNVEAAVECCQIQMMSYPEHDRIRYAKMQQLFESLYPLLKDSFRQLKEIDDFVEA